MITYKTRLSEYFAARRAIGMAFCTDAAKAEQVFESANKSAITMAAHEAAHYALKAQFRAANRARAAALAALGEPPCMPVSIESN
ncbi:MAG: hypothetical protein AAB327_03910 [Actinomycetota bacterium]